MTHDSRNATAKFELETAFDDSTTPQQYSPVKKLEPASDELERAYLECRIRVAGNRSLASHLRR
jgi:hypothetical protein